MTQTRSRHSRFPPGTDLASGDGLYLLLVWKPLQALTTDRKQFVHVAEGDGRPLAQ